ncbi:DoxX family protein [Pedobacter sp. SYSU D00535]|uniref:DoxX family protein n=1 Tax=Pedobacter sp. SYSU D00535 TaxID=2810308 RepID=UPI001A9568B3|nr:DoxX family protein [Pedobacter sp. SYSU D00535]
MTKTKKIVFWIATVWLSLGMVSTGIVQIIQMEEEVDRMQVMGYPSYFLLIIGVWKILGVIAILSPKLPLLKEWAYAGFFFLMSGAILSHLIAGSPATDFFGPLLLLVLTIISWYFRPADRKVVLA